MNVNVSINGELLFAQKDATRPQMERWLRDLPELLESHPELQLPSDDPTEGHRKILALAADPKRIWSELKNENRQLASDVAAAILLYILTRSTGSVDKPGQFWEYVDDYDFDFRLRTVGERIEVSFDALPRPGLRKQLT
jgi:hypothetical protein